MIEIKGYRSNPTDRGGILAKVSVPLSAREQFEAVAKFYQEFRYYRDIRDQWIDLDRFLLNGGGDCEDFAVAGHRLLRGMGWPVSSVCVVCGSLDGGQGHAMLAGYFDYRWHYLDSRDFAITAVDYFEGFQPVYAVDDVGEVYFLWENSDA